MAGWAKMTALAGECHEVFVTAVRSCGVEREGILQAHQLPNGF